MSTRFLRDSQPRTGGAAGRRAAPADLRARCHRQPRAELGPRLPHPGRDVRGDGGAGRARCPAGVLSWLHRVQGKPLDAQRGRIAPRECAPSRASAARRRSSACWNTPSPRPRKQRVHALIFVGDAMEENVDRLCKLAGELGLLGTPIFIFHEGRRRGGRRGVPPDREIVARRLSELRPGERRPVEGVARRRRGLRRRRLSRARRLQREKRAARSGC